MIPLTSLIFISTIIASGYCGVLLCNLRRHPIPLLFSIALSYGLGAGILTVGMLLLGSLSIPLTMQRTTFILILLPLILTVRSLAGHKHSMPRREGLIFPRITFDPLSFLFLIFLMFYTAYIFWRASHVPISTWDAFATHAFNAKILYYEQSLQYFNNMPHNNYPLHVPLLQAWFTLANGQWDDQLIKTPFPFYFISTLIVMYYFLIHYTRPRWALLGLLFLTSSSFLIYHATIGYRDFTLLYYNFTTIVLLLLWNKKNSLPFLILAALFSGFTSFTKLEGAGYLFIHLILLVGILLHQRHISIFNKIKNLLIFSIPSLSICLFFHIYRYLSLKQTTTQPLPDSDAFNLYQLKISISPVLIERLGVVLQKFITNMFFTNNWGIVFLIFILSLLRPKKKNITPEIKFLLLGLFSFFFIYVSAYTLTQHFYWIAHTEDVLSRCILHFFPLIPVLIILINFAQMEDGR